MRTSKYLFKTFNGWTCTHVGIARVQGKKTLDRKVSRNPGHQTYYYIFERQTSDGKADKMVRLSHKQAAAVYKGLLSIEELADKRQAKGENTFSRKVSYHFYNN